MSVISYIARYNPITILTKYFRQLAQLERGKKEEKDAQAIKW